MSESMDPPDRQDKMLTLSNWLAIEHSKGYAAGLTAGKEQQRELVDALKNLCAWIDDQVGVRADVFPLYHDARAVLQKHENA